MSLSIWAGKFLEEHVTGTGHPHFRKLLKEALEVETPAKVEGEPLMSKWEGPTTHVIASEVTMAVT